MCRRSKQSAGGKELAVSFWFLGEDMSEDITNPIDECSVSAAGLVAHENKATGATQLFTTL